jgi:hypothetical protein
MGAALMYAVQKALELKQIVTGVGEAAPNMTKIAGGNISTLGGMGGQIEVAPVPATGGKVMQPTPGGMGGQIEVAPPNATGGKVMQPAPGEQFASVAPGESIVPRGGAVADRAPPAQSGSRNVSVDVGGIHIEGAGKNAHEILALLESSLADLFERAALEAGGG